MARSSRTLSAPPVEGVEVRFTPQREILVRSPGLFREYHGDPQKTAQAKSAEGWFHTGDAGYLGEDGQLRIIDRMAYVGTLNDGTLSRRGCSKTS